MTKYNKINRKSRIGICHTCNKSFEYWASNLSGKYCSQKCYLNNPNHLNPMDYPEARRKISERMKINNPAKRPEIRKKISAKAKLRIFSEERKKKYSIQLKGKNNPNWKDGKSFEEYPKEFFDKRLFILKRDNFTCQLCNDFIPKFISKKRFLTIHHIDYNKKNNSENNLITLCNFCNSSANKNRLDWINHFNNLMEVKRNG